MIPQYQHSAEASLFFWAENLLVSSGQAYINKSSQLYYIQDERIPSDYYSYSSPFKQWVYDTSVVGAHICNGISGDITLSNNQSGCIIDYQNGRVLVPQVFGTGLNLQASYAFKEFNFYLSNETEESLLVDQKYYLNSRFGKTPTSGIRPYDIVTPAIFISTLNEQSKGRALGGLRDTATTCSLIVFAENLYQLKGVMSLFDDQTEKCIVQLSINDDPLDQFGNVKTGVYSSGYNYVNLRDSKANSSNLIYLQGIRSSKVSDGFQSNPRLFAGIIDVELSSFRQL